MTQVQALQQVLSAGRSGPSGQHAGRQARRRTTSYKSYRHVRRPNAKLRQAAGTGQNKSDAPDANAAEAKAAPDGGADAAAAPERPTSRAMRRRPGRLRAAAERSCATDVAGAGEPGRPRRLEAHVWHAKRMSMQERWGHMLPEGAVGKGHGSRHVLQLLHSGCLLHDASYWIPVQLTGGHAELSNLLQATTEPGTAERVLDAAPKPWREHASMLHHPGQWPCGTIGPSRLLLLPAPDGHAAHSKDPAPAAAAAAAAEAPERLWLWLHPAAYHETLAMLQQLCWQPAASSMPSGDEPPSGSAQYQRQQQGETVQGPTEQVHHQADQPPVAGPPQLQSSAAAQLTEQQHAAAAASRAVSAAAADIQITPLTAHLRRLELRGPASTALLAGLLPDFTALTSPPAPDGSVLSCMVQDPRLVGNGGGAAASDDDAADSDADADMSAADVEAVEAPPAIEGAGALVSAHPSRLWDQPRDALPPHSEHQVGHWRQQRRLAELGLAAEPPPLSTAEPAAAAACPALLVRCRACGAAAAGWSLVVPALWVGPLWQAALRRGAAAIGQREWRWVASDQGCAAFPWDFPDTRASVAEAAAEAAADAARCARATKAKQPLQAPQWHSLEVQPPAGADNGLPAQAAAEATPAPTAAAAVSAPPEAPAAPRLNAGTAVPESEQAAPGTEPRSSAANQVGEAAGPTSMDVDSLEATGAPAQPATAATVQGTVPAAATEDAAAAPGRRGKKRGKHKGTGGRKDGSYAAVAAAAGHSKVASSTAAAAAQSPPPLLPPGWWIARTAAALRQALPQTGLLPAAATGRSMQRLEGAATAAAAAAAAAGAPAADGASAALAPPVGTPTTSSRAPPAAVTAAAGSAGDVAQATGSPSGERCLVRVRVHMAGRGTAEAAAAIHCRLPAAAPDVPPTGTQMQQQPQHGQRTQLIGFVVAPAVRGACTWVSASALCSAAALDRVCQQQQTAGSGAEGAVRSGRQAGIPILVVHTTTGEHLPAEAFMALNGRAGDAGM